MARKKQIDKNLIIELHNQGKLDREIAEVFNCSRANVTHCLNKLGYHNRRTKIDNINLRNQISKTLIGRYTGKNNPNFRGYGSSIKQIARGLTRTIARKLLRESNHTCVICGSHTRLETHHLKPFDIVLNEFIENVYDGDISTIYDQITSYSDFMDENNLVIVCHDCHHKIHYTDDPELNPYRWESATTIENNQDK